MDRKVQKVMFSSVFQGWMTPEWLIKKVTSIYGAIDLDVAATEKNAVAARFFTKKDNALNLGWGADVAWMNPPYGRDVVRWVDRAYDFALGRKTIGVITCLLPARTDTAWFHDYCGSGHVRFLRGRVRFVHPRRPVTFVAPFPSMLVTFGTRVKPLIELVEWRA